jgi:hypothetical protein
MSQYNKSWLNKEEKIDFMLKNGSLNENEYHEYVANIKEMNKLSVTKMDNISYNFDYSSQFFQQNNFILFKIINFAIEGKSINNDCNAFFKYDEIIRIIYHIKKNIIDKSLNMIKINNDKEFINNQIDDDSILNTI